MNLGHDTYLVQIEDAIKQFAELKIRQMNVENKSKDCDLTCHLKQIEGERAQISMEISETITDYIGFLNRLNVYITVWYLPTKKKLFPFLIHSEQFKAIYGFIFLLFSSLV